MSLFTTLSQKASITIETALVLPLFLFFLLAFFVFFQVLHVQGRAEHCLAETAKELSAAGYAVQEGSVRTLGEAYVLGKLLAACPAAYREQMGVLYGAAGIVTAGTAICEEGERIDLQAGMRIETVFPYPVRKQAKTKARVLARVWSGSDRISEGSLGTEGAVVYRTVNGDVYHRDPSCSYLNPSVQAVSWESVDGRRNESGERYRACESCPAGNMGTVYITDSGNRYHSDLGCGGLKRTILTIPAEEAKDCPACSKCGR